MIKIGDFFIILIIAIITFGTFQFVFNQKANSGKNLTAIISVNGKIMKAIELEKVNSAFEVKALGNNESLIKVEKNRICFYKSNCPDKVCVNAGWLTKKGDIAMCIPLKVSVKIIDNLRSNDVDAVAY